MTREPNFTSSNDRGVEVDWYWYPARARTIMINRRAKNSRTLDSGNKFRAVQWKAPALAFGIVRKRRWRIFGWRKYALLVFASPKPVTSVQTMLRHLSGIPSSVTSRVCLGRDAQKMIRKGIMDPIEAFWNTAFEQQPKVIKWTKDEYEIENVGLITELQRRHRGHAQGHNGNRAQCGQADRQAGRQHRQSQCGCAGGSGHFIP